MTTHILQQDEYRSKQRGNTTQSPLPNQSSVRWFSSMMTPSSAALGPQLGAQAQPGHRRVCVGGLIVMGLIPRFLVWLPSAEATIRHHCLNENQAM